MSTYGAVAIRGDQDSQSDHRRRSKPIKHAVFVATRHPLGPTDHGRVAVLRTSLAALGKMADYVTVVVLRPFDADAPTRVGNCEFVAVPSFRTDKWSRFLRLLDPRRSLNEAAGLTARQSKAIIANLGPIDLLVLDGVRTSEVLSHKGIVPAFVDLDDMLSDRYTRWAALDLSSVPFALVGTQEGHWLNRFRPVMQRICPLLFRLEGHQSVRAEQRIGRLSEGISVVSQYEAQELAELTGRPVHVLPMAVGLAADGSVRPPEMYPVGGPFEYDVAFVGHVSYLTNLIGLEWFSREVMPVLSDLLGYQPRVAVVGSASPSVATWLESRNLDALGFQEDLVGCLHRAAVAIAPQPVPGGLVTKVLDYTRIGIPVVGTRSAFAGFGDEHTLPWHGIDDPAKMAERIALLINNRELAWVASRAASAFVDDLFAPDRLDKQWRAAFKQAVENYARQ